MYHRHRNEKEWYVCILSHNTTVLASDAVLARQDGQIFFGKEFRFSDLLSDFEIDIKLYSLNVKNKLQRDIGASDLQLNRVRSVQ